MSAVNSEIERIIRSLRIFDRRQSFDCPKTGTEKLGRAPFQRVWRSLWPREGYWRGAAAETGCCRTQEVWHGKSTIKSGELLRLWRYAI